jgi:2,3-bisphosphoglycerate-independent phosphoglycerate mutase
MSAYEITEKLIPKIISKIYAFILVNYANGDLVGHSANLAAGVKACEVVDQCLGRVVTTSLENNYTVLVTGDHGNIETMFYPNGEPNPSHGTNPVPFILITNEDELLTKRLKKGLGLSSVAPTILKLIGLKRPDEMNAPSIF